MTTENENPPFLAGESALELHLKHIGSTLVRIEKQVISTNGRVSSLEKWKYGMLVGIGTLAATKFPALSILLEAFVK